MRLKEETKISRGVYKIENLQNKMVYIGSSGNIEKRWEKHKTDLLQNKHHSYKLQEAFNEYMDLNNFKFEVVELVDNTKLHLLKREQFYIDKYNAFTDGYNCCEYSINPKYVKFNVKKLRNKKTTCKYIKVPRELIYANTIGDKRISCFSYFVFHTCLNMRSFYNCNYLIEWCGFKPKRNKGAMNDKFKQVFTWFYDNGLIHNYDDSNYSEKDFTEKNTVIVDLNRDWIFPEKQFGMVFDFEIDLIKEYSEKNRLQLDKRITHATVLLVLAYIRCNIRYRAMECYELVYEIKKAPEIFYKKYNEIAIDLGVPERICSKCVDILCDLQILEMAAMPRFKDDDGNWHTDSTIFANKYKYVQDNKTKEPVLYEGYDVKREIKYGKKIVASKSFTKVSKKNYENMEETKINESNGKI